MIVKPSIHFHDLMLRTGPGKHDDLQLGPTLTLRWRFRTSGGPGAERLNRSIRESVIVMNWTRWQIQKTHRNEWFSKNQVMHQSSILCTLSF